MPDYASAAEVFAAIARCESEVDARLVAVGQARAGAHAFASSVAAARERQRRERAHLRHRLGVAAADPAPPAPLIAPGGLAQLREAQQALVLVHAEGLPALHDTGAVDVLARHLVDLAAQLTVLDLWMEADEAHG